MESSSKYFVAVNKVKCNQVFLNMSVKDKA